MSTATKAGEAYREARARYLELGVDTDEALRRLDTIPISVQCWQGDDVRGFERPGEALTGGIQASGDHPGRARNGEELRADLDAAFGLIPGPKRLNLHAIYLESDAPVERDAIEPRHFGRWVGWAKARGVGLDFNPTCFSHPLSAQATLTHPDDAVREFWVRHCVASRRIAEHFSRELGSPSVMNIWIPDGDKDIPADRLGPRARLLKSLDAILKAPAGDRHLVAVEGKLFGIGTESYTAGSNDFYLAYAATRGILVCLDAGHFHPTEWVADKISTALCFAPGVLLHVSRPVRWDSDHVVLLDDATLAIAQEAVRAGEGRVHVGLDYFDASINRVAAWVIGARNVRKALLMALLEPAHLLRQAEASRDGAARLALLEELKSMPWAAVWERYCQDKGAPSGPGWLQKVRDYEAAVLAGRAS